MAQAHWRGRTIASSPVVEQVEGNLYFPPESVDRTFLRPSTTTTRCSWKGEAHYYDVVVDGEVNRDAAWYYPDPMSAATQIKDYVAFWRGVEVEP
jgi:uncharacterized protein (DUF427 family)